MANKRGGAHYPPAKVGIMISSPTCSPSYPLAISINSPLYSIVHPVLKVTCSFPYMFYILFSS